MSIKDRKSRESDTLRRKILRATLRVFAEQGYAKVSMRKIAALIDYSPTTIYRFFRNKEDLLCAIAAETYGDLAARFEKAKAEGGGGPLGLLKSLVREYIAFCVERPEMFKMYADIVSFEMEDGALYERLGGTRYKVFQSWFQGIRRAVASGGLGIRDETRVFLYLWDSVHGYLDHRIRQDRVPRKPLAVDAAAFLDLVFRGIEAKQTK
jgi:AcrR family transcriptional regulator